MKGIPKLTPFPTTGNEFCPSGWPIITLKELEVDRVRYDQYLAWLQKNKGKPVPTAKDPYPLRYYTVRKEVTHMACSKKKGKKGCKK